MPRSGPWTIEIPVPGSYRFELSRWPIESGLGLRAASPEHQGPDGTYPAGVALVAKARLRVGPFDQTVAIPDPAAQGDLYSVDLPAGNCPIQTYFLDDNGQELCGAYFVYASRVASKAPTHDN